LGVFFTVFDKFLQHHSNYAHRPSLQPVGQFIFHALNLLAKGGVADLFAGILNRLLRKYHIKVAPIYSRLNKSVLP
jgi:hypothetical protein